MAPEAIPGSSVPRPSADRLLCPRCKATMDLARVVRVPAGFEIHTYDCTGCDHAHIVTVAAASPIEAGRPGDVAADALEEARQMAPGARRNEALKNAGRLRSAADNPGLDFLRGRSRKR